MSRAGLALALALAIGLPLAGCARASVPPLKTPVLSPQASRNLSADDVAFAKELLDSQTEIVVAGQGRPTFETTTLADFAAARSAFSGARFPRVTLGRGLVTIIYRRAVTAGALPRETLFLVYSGRLLISEAPAFRLRIPLEENATRETTMVGGVEGTVEFLGEQTVVGWEVPSAGGAIRYRITAPTLTKAEAVHIARSMAP